MINRIINILKWPIALLMAWSFPAAILLLWNFIISQQYTFQNFPPIVIGFLGYMLLWYLIFRRQSVGSYLSTLEHECTHALFAILTGHSVHGIRVTAYEGGQVAYKGGEGNWLIVIAPYFFPTITFILLTIRLFIQPNYWFEMGVGVSIGFHIGSSVYETHAGQTDLQKAGKFFSFCFLPTANLLTYVLIASYLSSGLQGISHSILFMAQTVTRYSIEAYHYGYAVIGKMNS